MVIRILICENIKQKALCLNTQTKAHITASSILIEKGVYIHTKLLQCLHPSNTPDYFIQGLGHSYDISLSLGFEYL